MPAPNPPGVVYWFRAKLGECSRIPRGVYEGSPVVLIPNPTDDLDIEVRLKDGRRLSCIDNNRPVFQVHTWLSEGKTVRASIYSIADGTSDDGRNRPYVRVLCEFMDS